MACSHFLLARAGIDHNVVLFTELNPRTLILYKKVLLIFVLHDVSYQHSSLFVSPEIDSFIA